MNRRGWLFAAVGLTALGLSEYLRPSRHAADELTHIDLNGQVPEQFANWTLDRSMTPVLPNPEVQDKLDKIYTQVIARTYVRNDGAHVYFTIAYGADQATDATSVHRPEFCYSAQGFAVKSLGDRVLKLGKYPLNVRRLEGRLGSRYEPITYWVTLNEKAVLPGINRKLQQVKFGLAGLIPDGMLVRLSTINVPEEQAFRIQEEFIRDLHQNIDSQLTSRYFGRKDLT